MSFYHPNLLDDAPLVHLKSQSGATAVVSLFGGHLISWIPSAEMGEQLYVSRLAQFDGHSAIRGGVPILFPGFGKQASMPSHGFARLSHWQEASRTQHDGADSVTLTLEQSDFSKQWWPYDFELNLTITLSDNWIRLEYQVSNTGDEAFTFAGGLHSYFSTKAIAQTRVIGLQDCSYTEAGQTYQETSTELQIDGHTDRIYHTGKSGNQVELRTPDSRLDITSQGFDETVVWNPWKEGNEAIADMANGDFDNMICVEAVIASHELTLAPGKQWSGSQTIRVL